MPLCWAAAAAIPKQTNTTAVPARAMRINRVVDGVWVSQALRIGPSRPVWLVGKGFFDIGRYPQLFKACAPYQELALLSVRFNACGKFLPLLRLDLLLLPGTWPAARDCSRSSAESVHSASRT